jgi:hypothetical protein
MMTEKRYFEEVNKIERLDPGNLFLPRLRGAHTAVTEAYLMAAWKRVPKTAKTIIVKEVESSPNTPRREIGTGQYKKPKIDDDVLNNLFREKGHIGREMRKVRANRLLDAKSPAERKAVMRELDEMQGNWAIVQRKIRVYEQTGALPVVIANTYATEQEAKEKVEDWAELSDMQLLSKLQSIRVCHSRLKKKIEGLDPSVMDAVHPFYKNWQKMEADLKRYELDKRLVEVEIKKRKDGEK